MSLLRNRTSRANLGLLQYYFGSKEGLYLAWLRISSISAL